MEIMELVVMAHCRHLSAVPSGQSANLAFSGPGGRLVLKQASKPHAVVPFMGPLSCGAVPPLCRPGYSSLGACREPHCWLLPTQCACRRAGFTPRALAARGG
ncbi:unnamed protein product [Gadus morhua 'NCC']